MLRLTHIPRSLALVAATAVAVAVPAATAGAAHQAATIHPGVQTVTEGGQCTANFVFTDNSGALYLGQAAHCAGTGGATETNGCDSGSLPLGTRVEVDGASRPGTLAYSSWIAMQQARERDADACDYNDFALVRIDPADAARVDPRVPHFGGPTGVRTTGLRFGDDVYSYGNSSLRFGISATSPKQGVSMGDGGNGWVHTVYTATPGIPGDSGSGLLDSAGRATGVLSTVAIAPLTGSNNYADLNKAMAYAATHGGPAGLRLVTGGAFTPGLI